MIYAQQRNLPKGIVRLDAERIVFRNSSGGRIAAAVFALILGAFIPLVVYLQFVAPYTSIWGTGGEVLIFGALCSRGLYLSGPSEINLDLYRGTYRWTHGSLFAPRTQQGALTEFCGVYVGGIRSNSNNHPPDYRVWLVWAEPGRADLCLYSNNDTSVDWVMEQVAQALHIPSGLEALGALWYRNKRLRRYDEQRMCFHKPLAFRIVMGVLGKSIAIAAMVVSGALVLSRSGLHLHSGTFNFYVLGLDALGLICLRAAGPEDLELDLQNRTYRCHTGFPGFARTRRGTFADILALKTDEQGNNGGHRVRLIWRHYTRAGMTLAEFTTDVEAEAHLRMIRQALGIQIEQGVG